jgi:hypothetical protein
MLPREELYMPPMNIRVRDHRQFGRKPTVGIHVLKSLEEYRCVSVKQEPEADDDGVQGKKGRGQNSTSRMGFIIRDMIKQYQQDGVYNYRHNTVPAGWGL